MEILRGRITAVQSLRGALSVPDTISPEHYGGVYSVIPSDERQVLPTSGLVADADIVVEPIPSNYGLITWDGSTLMVS